MCSRLEQVQREEDLVLDMGEPVKILDFGKKSDSFIRIHGRRRYRD